VCGWEVVVLFGNCTVGLGLALFPRSLALALSDCLFRMPPTNQLFVRLRLALGFRFGSVTAEHLRSSTFFNTTAPAAATADAPAPLRFFFALLSVELSCPLRSALWFGSYGLCHRLVGVGWLVGCRSAAAFVRFLKIVTRCSSK